MDGPRRWQLASSVTAAAGLGIGALLLTRTTAPAAEPIDLDPASVVEQPADPTGGRFEERPEIVVPVVIEDAGHEDTAGSPASTDDPGSPDDGSREDPETPDAVDAPTSVDSA